MFKFCLKFVSKVKDTKEENMTFKKWAWDIFETTGNPEAFLAVKEAEKLKTFGNMEFGNLEIENSNKKQPKANESQERI